MIDFMHPFLPQRRLAYDEPQSETDLEAMVTIHAEGFRRGWSLDEFERLIAEKTVRTLLLRRESVFGTRTVVGFVMLRVVAGEAEVLTVAVGEARRGRGYGRRLMEEALRRLYADAVESVFLEVSEVNDPALALYRRLGFKEVGRRKGYYADGAGGATALVMRLQLR